MGDVRLAQIDRVRSVGEFVAILLMIGGVVLAVSGAIAVNEGTAGLQRMGMSVGFGAYLAAMAPGFATTVFGLSLLILSKLLETVAVIAEHVIKATRSVTGARTSEPSGGHPSE